MIKVFAELFNWLECNALEPAKYKITITPLTVDAEARLKTAWMREVRGMLTRPANAETFTGGYLHGVPFEIKSHAS